MMSFILILIVIVILIEPILILLPLPCHAVARHAAKADVSSVVNPSKFIHTDNPGYGDLSS